jgi:branched-subunit amino acid transport protein
MTGIWVAVLVTAAGCYALKLTGLVVPRGVLGNPRVRRFAELVPIALLAALVAVQTFAAGQSLTIDPARLAGLGAAVAALLLRAPFLVVIVVAAGTAAGRGRRRGGRARAGARGPTGQGAGRPR